MSPRHFVLGLTIALGIGAYPLLAALLSLIGAGESRTPTIALRVGIAVLAIIAAWMNRKSMRLYSPIFITCFFVFWSMYIFRVLYNVHVDRLTLPFGLTEMLGYIILFVLIPVIPLFAGLSPFSSRKAFNLLMIISVFTLLAVFPQFSELANTLQDSDNIRFKLEKLNPISVGYVGATLLLLSVTGFFQKKWEINPLFRGIFVVTAMLGLFALIASASRGPALATVVALVVYGLVPLRGVRLIVSSVGLMIVAGATIVVQKYILATYGFDIMSRILGTIEKRDEGGESRDELFAGAWQQFSNSPLIGDAIIERSYQYFPHNLVLEALMATGIVGGGAFILMLIMMLIAALRLLTRPGYEWIGLLGIVYGISGMFSGNHPTGALPWLAIVLITATEWKLSAYDRAPRRRPDKS